MGRGGWATGWALSSILRAYLLGIFPITCVTSAYCLYTAWADGGILEVLLQLLLWLIRFTRFKHRLSDSDKIFGQLTSSMTSQFKKTTSPLCLTGRVTVPHMLWMDYHQYL